MLISKLSAKWEPSYLKKKYGQIVSILHPILMHIHSHAPISKIFLKRKRAHTCTFTSFQRTECSHFREHIL